MPEDRRGRRPNPDSAEPEKKKATLGGWVAYLTLLIVLLACVAVATVSWRQVTGLSRYQQGVAPTPPLSALSRLQVGRLLWEGIALPRPAEHADPTAIAVPHTQETFTTDSGVSLQAWRLRHEEPAGTVLMVPDHGQTKGTLLPEGLAIHKLGWDVMLLDVRGTGGSDGKVTSWGWREAEDVVAANDRLRKQTQGPVVLFGRGAGAAAVLRAVHMWDLRPEAVVLDSPWPELRTVVEGLMRRWGLPAGIPGHTVVFFFGVHHSFSGFDLTPRTYACSVTMPSLVLHGAAHATVTTAEAREVHDALAGDKQWALFGKAGNGGGLVEEPKRWGEAMAALLAQAAAEHARRRSGGDEESRPSGGS